MEQIEPNIYKNWILIKNNNRICAAYDTATCDIYAVTDPENEVYSYIDSHYSEDPDALHTNVTNETLADFQVENLVVCVAEKCNMACKYCFADAGTYHNKRMPIMGTKEFEKLKYFAWNIQPNGAPSIHFFGGEPLLANDKIIEFCKTMRQESDKNGKQCPEFSVTTNGTLITEDLAKAFAELDFKLCISLDGPKEIHDNNRVYPNGSGTYDATMRGLKLLQKYHVPTAIEATISLSAIEKYTDAQLWEYFDFFRECGVIEAAIFFDVFEKELLPETEKTILKFCENAVDYCINLLVSEEEVTFVLMDIIGLIGSVISNSGKRTECAAGLKQLFITVDGELYPCQAYYSAGACYLGNCDDMEMVRRNQEKILKTKANRTPDECRKCVYRFACAEKCPGSRLLAGGHENQLRTHFCFAQKAYINRIIYRLAEISQDEEKKKRFDKNLKSAFKIASQLKSGL